MDADELVVWRCRRVSGRSAWRKHVGRVQKRVPTGAKTVGIQGKLEGLKDGPNPDASTSESGPNRRPNTEGRG